MQPCICCESLRSCGTLALLAPCAMTRQPQALAVDACTPITGSGSPMAEAITDYWTSDGLIHMILRTLREALGALALGTGMGYSSGPASPAPGGAAAGEGSGPSGWVPRHKRGGRLLSLQELREAVVDLHAVRVLGLSCTHWTQYWHCHACTALALSIGSVCLAPVLALHNGESWLSLLASWKCMRCLAPSCLALCYTILVDAVSLADA